MARNDYANGNRVNISTAMKGRRDYWEVDPTHPIYGKGSKWTISKAAYLPWKYEVYWFWDMQHNNKYPGGNEKFGTKVHPYDNDPWYWTIAYPDADISRFFVMRGHSDFRINFNDYYAEYFKETWTIPRYPYQASFVRYQISYMGITYLDEFKQPLIIPKYDN